MLQTTCRQHLPCADLYCTYVEVQDTCVKLAVITLTITLVATDQSEKPANN